MVEQALDFMRKDLAAQYTKCVQYLQDLEIPFVSSSAGLFTMINLRRFLDEDSWDGEMRLRKRLFKELKIIFTPGVTWFAINSCM